MRSTTRTIAISVGATFLILLTLCLPCYAATPSTGTISVDSAAVKADPRLDRPVTLSLIDTPVKLVLDEMARQTGVAISIDVRDPASSYGVFLQCDRAPVSKLMNGLYGLFSIRKGEWAWVRQGKTGAFEYVLHETPWAKNRNGFYMGIISGLMRGYLNALSEMAPMSMDERKRSRDKLKQALLVDDDARVDAFFADEMFWTQAKFFLGALSQAQQDNVLSGVPASVSISTLPNDMQSIFHSAYLQQDVRHTNKDGTQTPVPEPTSIEFTRIGPNGYPGEIAPTVAIVTPGYARTWMGTGNLEFGVRDAIKRAWMLPGDNALDAIAGTVTKEVADSDQVRAEELASEATLARINGIGGHSADVMARITQSMRTTLSVAARLQQVSGGVPVPIIALLPSRKTGGMSTPVGKPLKEFLNSLEGRLKQYMCKWRDGVLVVNYPVWFTVSTPAISYSVLGSLHPDKTGQVPLDEWEALMRNISDDQADWFASTYGVSNMKVLRPALLLVARNLNVLNRDGADVDADVVRDLKKEALLPQSIQPTDQGTRVRITQLTINGGRQAGKALQLWTYDEAPGKWRMLGIVPLPAYRGSARAAITSP